MNKFYNAQNAGHGGDFRCEECLKMFYITKNDIKHRYKCLCDICYKCLSKREKTKYKKHKSLRKNTRKPPKPEFTRVCYKSKPKRKTYKKNKKKRTNKRSKHQHKINERRKELIQLYECCEICGYKPIDSKYLHIHHKDQDVSNNMYSNLLLLCVSCHAKQHKNLPGIYTLLKKQEQKMLNS